MRGHPPAGISLLAAKLIAVAGAAVAGLLAFFHFDALHSRNASGIPLCGGTAWLDCESVLNSSWSTVFGLPVAVLGLGAWLITAVVLLLPRLAESRIRQALLVMTGMLLAGAAGFYTYLQLAVLGAVCLWCTVDHLLGIALLIVVLVGLKPKLTAGMWGVALGLAVVGTAGLVVASVISNAGTGKLLTVRIEVKTADGRWIETDEPAHAITFSEGDVVLDRRTRPIIGSPDATKLIMEMIDPRCGRCATFAPTLKQAMTRLGPEFGLIIGYVPSGQRCNHYIQATPAYAENSCELTELALAVWLTRPAALESFHDWLLAEQETLTLDDARRRAAGLVGEEALTKALADPRLAQMIRRDVDLAARLNIGMLPGLVVGDAVFSALPSDPAELANLIRLLVKQPNAGAAVAE